MKVTLNWLKQYVEFNWSPEQLAERLTMLGIEVEGIQKLGGEFGGIVVAEVLTREKHPNADKLSVCKVADGSGERQIVCGATNFKVGDKVPLILPGSSLPAKGGHPPLTIKAGRIRGVESQGMMCSPQELGLAEDAEGLLLLPSDAKVGQPFAEHLGRAAGDVVYDLEITPNRPDLNSAIGIAREISALTGNPLRMPDVAIPKSSSAESVEKLVSVRVEDADLCPRYTARVIRGVKVGPSPDWLRQILEKIGLRSINNVVDVTNFVMMESGQPLHAFDYHLIAKDPARADSPPQIIIRRAGDVETFVTLDGQKRVLDASMLMIADATRAVALAGIMGGQDSEINERTVDVLLESACFNPANIRATSKKLELRTESSYRFERGGDIEIVDWASRRAAQLIIETAGGQAAEGTADAYPTHFQPKRIALRYGKVGQILGVAIPPADNVKYLSALGLRVVEQSAEACAVEAPSFRVDLKREIDLIEEITRLHGVDKIPSTPPRNALGSNSFDAVHDELGEARRILVGLGLSEAQGQTLISSKAPHIADPVALQNPLSSEMDVLRPSLLPGLLDALRHNANHKNADVAIFEIGRTFARKGSQASEQRRVALALTGHSHAPFWAGENRDAKFDIYDLKGAIEEFFEQFGVRGVTCAARAQGTAFWVESAVISLGKFELGEMGQLMPTLARQLDLRDPVLLAELNMDQLLARRSTSRSFKPLPAFPAIRRDVAMIVPEAATHQAVLDAIKQARGTTLEGVQLFDVFRGQNVPAGHKSLAYAFTYRSLERTLTDGEVNTAHQQVVAHLKRALGAVIRD
jgi:phenylalanyl-tRNA synthetase beta chain